MRAALDPMAVLPSSGASPTERRGSQVTVFGLDVRADRALPFLQTASARPTGKTVRTSVIGDPEALGWPRGAELICDQRQVDGSAAFGIESATAGYRIWGPGRGDNVISSDGSRLSAAVGPSEMEAWQRLLIAQVLPFTAVLRGLEVFHASAVVLEQGAVAFLGRSGAGKTSLALDLCRRGAGFLTDDVLAIERSSGLLAHPGAPVAAISKAELARLIRLGNVGCGERLSEDSREQVARMSLVAAPTPLRAMFFLDRRDRGPGKLRFEPLEDWAMLLAATFNLVLSEPRRLERLLEICALAAGGRIERVVIGPGVDATELGAAIERRMAVGR